MSVTEMVNAARGTGLTGTPLVTAIAISLAEDTDSDPKAIHHNSDGSVDRGYWQINSVHTQYDPNRLLNDPAYNAHAMYEISNGGKDWSPWATYPAKAQSHTAQAQSLASGTVTAAANAENAGWGIPLVPGGPSINPLNPLGGLGGGNSLNPLSGITSDITGAFKALGSLTSHLLDGRWWARVGQGALAFLLLVLALLLIFRKQAARIAIDVATDGLAEGANAAKAATA